MRATPDFDFALTESAQMIREVTARFADEQIAPLAFDASMSNSGIAAISVSDAVADKLLAQADGGKTLVQLQTELDKGTLMQGFVETSNVNVVQELVTMIQTQRAYEMNSKAIQTSDQMLAKLSQL